MYFPLGTLKGIFTLNKIKIDAADISRPKSKITVSKKSFFFLSLTLFEILPERCQGRPV